MFTGIVQQQGSILAIKPEAGGARLSLSPEPAIQDLRDGESIAIDGCCLTVEPGSAGGRLGFFLSDETLKRTTLGNLRAGARVNLERALAAGDRLGGHWVMGHVDGVGTITRLEQEGEAWLLEVQAPGELLPYLAPKGSVTVDGISLTIVDQKGQTFTVAVIPHTYQVTTLGTKGGGSPVNLEVDPLARYVVHYLSRRDEKTPVGEDLLRRAGFC